MKEDLKSRCQKLGRLMVEKRYTIRQLVEIAGVSRTTIHKDLTMRLPMCNSKLAKEVQVVLDQNKAERASRGGKAVQRKIKAMRQK